MVRKKDRIRRKRDFASSEKMYVIKSSQTTCNLAYRNIFSKISRKMQIKSEIVAKEPVKKQKEIEMWFASFSQTKSLTKTK